MTLSSYNIYQQLNSAAAATTADLGGVYFNGRLGNGIGANITNVGSLVPLVIDNVILNVYDRVLVNSQNNNNENGIYVVIVTGNNSTAWVLQRSNDFQSIAQLKEGQYLSINDGDTNAGKVYVLVSPLPAKIGISPIFFDFPTGGGGGGSLLITNNLDDVASASVSRTNLGLEIGTNVEAHSVVLDNISAGTYTGATSITTLGTVTTGTWDAGLITASFGGTGVNNGSKTISLGANFSTIGVSNIALTSTGNTNVTLPVSGTLATVAGSLQVSNNLSDLASVSTARSNLGLGTASTQAATDFLLVANNLSDLNSASTARTNLGLGSAATSSSSAFAQVANNLSDLSSASTARVNLGVAIGSNVQAYSAILDNVVSGTYFGSSAITTLGTISTGTWQGSVIGPVYGGTGINNGSNTITLAGNLVTAGANNLTFTTTGTTNVTLPTSGTLLSSTSGTFTPTLTGSSVNPTAIAYTNQIGRYTTVDNLVHVYVRVTVSTLTIGIAAGDLQITGLPIASANISNMVQVLDILAGSLTYTSTQLSASIDPNTQIINISQSSAATPITKLAISAILAGTDIIIEGFYFTS